MGYYVECSDGRTCDKATGLVELHGGIVLPLQNLKGALMNGIVDGLLKEKLLKVREIYIKRMRDIVEGKTDFDKTLAIVCVVDNGPFDAALFCHDIDEFEMTLNEEDERRKIYVIVPRKWAEEASGYDK